jgi:hypothetical protein
VEGTCSSNPDCAALGLLGECCPSPLGVYLECCDDKPEENGTCSANQDCVDLGLLGDCCPTSFSNETFLSCCDESPAQGTCYDNRKCRRQGLEGDCCPTDSGIYLECCDDKPTEGTCYENRRCKRLGLQGACCPTDTGEYLECCDEVTPLSGTCSEYPRCEGLSGDCCPNSEGVYLDCCLTPDLPRSAQCSRNKACAALNLTGYCCPSPIDDIFLACCDETQQYEVSGKTVQLSACEDCVVSSDYSLGTIAYSLEAVDSSQETSAIGGSSSSWAFSNLAVAAVVSTLVLAALAL